MKFSIFNFQFSILLLLLLSGCCKELVDHPPASTQRTVLVYLGVDNNFKHEAAEKIETLTRNWNKNFDGNLLVYADAGAKPVLVHIYNSERRGNVADTIASYTAENSAGSATFARVLNTVKAYRPAASYGLIVLSHASGWLPADMSWPIKLRSVIVDTENNEINYMELADFAKAIPYKLDFAIFDACFMGAVEVGYELKEKVDYLVASPAEVLAPGFVYASMMQHLFQPQPDLEAVASDFYEYYNNSGIPSATVSLLKTSALDALIPIFKEITAGVHPFSENIGNIQTFGFGNQKIYCDLGHRLQQLAPEKSIAIEVALEQCVLYKKHTPSYYSAGTGMMHPIHAFSGLTVYIPQAAYPQANAAYSHLKWAKATDYVVPF
jgi:hypothetical protein